MRVVTALGFSAVWRFRKWPMVAAMALAILVLALVTPSRAEAPDGCIRDLTGGQNIGAPKDLKIDRTCYVRGGTYTFSHVNIVAGGKLVFVEPTRESAVKRQDFWATSIIIENGGAIYAGVDVPGDKEMVNVKPYGTNGRTLTFHLYGADPRGGDPKKVEGPGVSCAPIEDAAKFADCGIPLKQKVGKAEQDFWAGNGNYEFELPGKVHDYFYQYGSLVGDKGVDPDTKQSGHFGYKVLALSYGGTLQLRGRNGTGGTTKADIDNVLLQPPDKVAKEDMAKITDSGMDWVRLKGVDGNKLTLDRKVDWATGSEIIVTTTDYLPEHSEVRTLAADADGTDVVTLNKKLDYQHSVTAYDIGKRVGTDVTTFRTAVAAADGLEKTPNEVPFLKTAETRAAVALLTRSIRIVSEGDKPGDTFEDATKGNASKIPPIKANPNYMYGGQVAFRQGFEKLQIQGVEFKQLGQGGLLGRYPVHFHMARNVPADTYVIDSSVNESMTRWFVIHSTIGVTLARNVGYKSIGHGYFLEDATETDNKLYSNIGIFARASVVSAANDRNIPGLLDAPNAPNNNYFPLKYNSDSRYPSVFWITNGWNSLAGNMAAGAGTCGSCYWYVPAGNHDMVEVGPDNTPMKWSGYSEIQADPKGPFFNGRAGLSPVRMFYKNYCSTAMHSLTVTDGSTCTAMNEGKVVAVKNTRAPDLPPEEPKESTASKMYYPRYTGIRDPAYCDGNSCSTVTCDASNPQFCAPSVFSHYTSSFNWADSNFSAIWLRKGYLLLDHAFVSDVQGPGVTLITGGDYTRANLPLGYWGVTSNSIFAGITQLTGTNKLLNSYASERGPIDASGKRACDWFSNFCRDNASGVTYPLTAWNTEQRMFNIYDGPAYQDANAFLDIYPSKCATQEECMYYGGTLGVRAAQTAFSTVPDGKVTVGQGFLPNAAIGWKQSNGFYYPPAFHSRNLFFKDVGIRHYVVEPLTFAGTYRTNTAQSWKQYAGIAGNQSVFRNFSDVDRQTELNDDDGSLTGLDGWHTASTETIEVNEDPFFRAPVQTAQCRSNVGVDARNACAGKGPPSEPATARTSPYGYVTTALFPDYDPRDNTDKDQSSLWNTTCSNENCTGVPIYREYLTGVKGKDAASSTREWATWMTGKCDDQFKSLRDKIRQVPSFDPYDGKDHTKEIDGNAFLKLDRDCPSPFVRMAGMNLGQRSVLTVNNGRYFIDTTQSAGWQRTTKELESVPNPGWERNISVFEAKKSYYVFFVFAKPDTHQVYQIYVGPGFNADSITGTRVNISGLSKASFGPWNQDNGKPWTAKMDEDNPNVVDVDFDFRKVKQDNKTNLNPKNLASDDTCQPRSYCSKASGSCACEKTKLGILGLLDPNYKNVCDNVCKEWAVKDIDCPKGGCLGFKFTMPENFKAQDQFERPKPLQFVDKPWKEIVFKPTTTSPDGAPNAGGCHYTAAQIPNDSTACKVAD
jgi:cell migration-inducing and hyaluronan-binding protein